MANWTELKAAIAVVIKTNGNQEITGAILQSTLDTIISNVGENATFKGIAISTTIPETPDGNIFYIASNPGVYANFSGITLIDDEICILLYNDTWTKNVIIKGAINSPFVSYNNNIFQSIIDIKIYAVQNPYKKYALKYLWRNNSTTWYLGLVAWDGTTWISKGDWIVNNYIPTSEIETIKIAEIGEITIDWSLVPNGTAIEEVTQIKKSKTNIKFDLSIYQNTSYDVFPINVTPKLNGIEYIKIFGSIPNKIYFVKECDNITGSYRLLEIGYCDPNGSNYVKIFEYVISVENFININENTIFVNGHSISYRIDWTKIKTTGTLTYLTGALLKSVYSQPNPESGFYGINYVKILGNSDISKIFYISKFEKTTGIGRFRRIIINSCNSDGTNSIEMFSPIIYANSSGVFSTDIDVFSLENTVNKMQLKIELDWSKLPTWLVGSYLTTPFPKSVYKYNAYVNNASFGIKDNISNQIFVNKNGDITTIEAAYNLIKNSDINNQFEVIVFPGTYNEVNLKCPKYTHTHGLTPNSVVVTSMGLGGTLPVFDQQYGSSKLSNMKIISDTGYTIHYDLALDSEILVNENLHLVKINYAPIIGGGSFFYGTTFIWRNCIFENGTVDCHTNMNKNYENTHLIFENPKLINAHIQLGSVGGFGHCVCDIRGLYTRKGEISIQNQNSPLRNLDLPSTYFANTLEWQIIGGNNQNLLTDLVSTGESLQFEASGFSEDITISGTAVDLIFGQLKTKKGNARIKSTVTGTLMVKDQQAGQDPYSSPVDVYQLWKRLGDCSAINKTLSVTKNGTTQTYTFNQNYLSSKASEATILAAINAVINVAILKKNVQTTCWDNVNLSEVQSINVQTTNGILVNEFVLLTGYLAANNSENKDIFGIALESGIANENIKVWIGNVFKYTAPDGDYGIINGLLSIAATTKIGYVKSNIFYRN